MGNGRVSSETLNIKKLSNVRTLTKVAVLGSFSFVIMLIEFPLPLFAAFLRLDFSDVPALIGAFAMGPWAGVAVELIKNILHAVFKNETALIGETANFLTGSIMVFTAGWFYSRKKTFKIAVMGMAAGVVLMAVLMSFANYYIFIPLYQKLLHIPLDAIVQMGTAANKAIIDLKTLVVYSIVPFNLLKGVVVSLITIMLYKRVSPILHS